MDEQLMIPTGGKKRSCKKRQSNGGQAQWRPMLPAIQ